ncbi:MAG: hypothetical protein GY705_14045 [Bacteroidetes bacterium]|nr:hypothetical protein [Bacteroidota bacterium]
MKILFLLFSLLLYANTSTNQPGFSKWFDFGMETYFYNALFHEDTIVVAGASWNESTEK